MSCRLPDCLFGQSRIDGPYTGMPAHVNVFYIGYRNFIILLRCTCVQPAVNERPKERKSKRYEYMWLQHMHRLASAAAPAVSAWQLQMQYLS